MYYLLMYSNAQFRQFAKFIIELFIYFHLFYFHLFLTVKKCTVLK